MKILSRYVLKEHAGPLVFALAALTSLLLLNYVAKQFGALVGKGLPWTAILEFFGLSIPFTVATTLPMAVLISTLYAFSRLAAENEITALKASGVGMPTVMIPALGAATVLAIVMIGFNDQILSRANHQLAVLQTDIARTKPTFALREQVINPVSPGRLYVRTGHIDRSTNRMREVTIYDLSDPTRARTIYANSGLLGFTADGQDLVMTLFDGWMQEVSSTDPGQLQRLFFTRNRMRVRGIGSKFQSSQDVEYKGPREKTICEMQRDYVAAQAGVKRGEVELSYVLRNNVRMAASGLSASPPAVTPMDSSSGVGLTIGGAYCRLLGLFGVKQALAAQPARAAEDLIAAEPPQFGATRAQKARQRAEIERQRGQQDSAAMAAARAGNAPPNPALGTADRGIGLPPSAGFANAQGDVAVGAISALRDRITESKRTRDMFGVEIHKKFSLAVACIVFVLIGAPIALRFPRGGVGLVISVSLSVFALYYVGLIAGQSLAENGTLSPFLSMWLTNIVFTIVGLILLARMGKESSTARGGDMREMLDMARSWIAGQMRRLGFKVDRRRRVA
ncbi:MAG TPA: LptF/LptG family permease [Gemmatimonadaceae bacterium]|nr:LptF/LptG family permease [Gemmatimonadaceae bacterium]